MCGQLIIYYDNDNEVFDSWYTNASSLLDCTLLRQLFVYKKYMKMYLFLKKEILLSVVKNVRLIQIDLLFSQWCDRNRDNDVIRTGTLV